MSQIRPLLNIRVIDSHSAWLSLREDWDRLAGSNVFLRFQWLYRWWEQYGRDEGRLSILHLSDSAGVTRGFAPWWQSASLSSGRVLQFLGSGDVCSDYLSLLSAAEDRSLVADAVADWLATNRNWDMLELDGAVASDEAVGDLVAECRRRDMPVAQKPAMNCWRLELPDSWENYLAGLSKSHRKQLRRIDRRMLQTGELVFHEAQTERDRERVFGLLVRLHQKRWQSVGEPGVFSCPRFLEFLRTITVDWFEEGRVRLYELARQGRTVATEIHLVDGDVSFAYQSGVDPDSLDLEPGRALNIAVIQHLIGQGFQAIDYLRGDEPYKQHLRAEPHPLAYYRIGAPKASGRLRHQAWVAGGLVKSWIKGTVNLGGVGAP